MSTNGSERLEGERIDRVTAARALLQLVEPTGSSEGATAVASITVLPDRRSDSAPRAAVA
jgi:hypothetical protein